LGYSDVLDALNAFGELRSDILLVHSSLPACGHIRGGPATVIRALRDWCPAGTIVMPSHSYCYPQGADEAPIFQSESTPSDVGAIADLFWRQPTVIRSVHPSHSLACFGPRSQEICEGHEWCATPCGPGTPYERLIEAGASVLMFGVPMSCYTLYYASEDAAGVPYVYFPHQFCLRVAEPGGDNRVMLSWRHSRVPRRFEQIGDLMEAEGLIARRPLGRGTLRMVLNAGDVHRWLLAHLAQDPWLLVERASAARVL
jgi:aminoglycoside 3-N-acetyltransferase